MQMKFSIVVSLSQCLRWIERSVARWQIMCGLPHERWQRARGCAFHLCLNVRGSCYAAKLRRNRSERSNFSLAPDDIANKTNHMKNYTKILFSILAAVICTAAFAADKPTCKQTGKNCPMNDNKQCNCGKK